MLYLEGIPLNVYIINPNPNTGRVEIVKPTPPGQVDELLIDFPNVASARAWAETELHAGRLPLKL
jgi:hypothetical protein